MTDTFDEITAECDEAPLLYLAILENLRPELSAGRTMEYIGITAWDQLTTDERRTALPTLLGCYVTRVIDEERERAHQAHADDPTITTCLEDSDTASAWDALADHTTTAAEPHETVIDRDVLTRLLDELDLLRRRAASA